jgi:hypothetical protein
MRRSDSGTRLWEILMAANPETKNGRTDQKPRGLGDAWRLLVQSALARGGAHVEKPLVDVEELKKEIKRAVEDLGG